MMIVLQAKHTNQLLSKQLTKKGEAVLGEFSSYEINYARRVDQKILSR